MYNLLTYNRSGSLANLFNNLERNVVSAGSAVFAFRTDIIDEKERYVLKADLPGYQKEEIEVDVTNGVLTITAKHAQEQESQQAEYVCRERRTGTFIRSFNIEGIDQEGVSASFENGVLTLSLPKRPEVIPQSRKIDIG